MHHSYYYGKTAIVVGGSEGIGLAVAESLAKKGANLIICSRSQEKLNLAVQRLESHRNYSQQFFTCSSVDITNFSATLSTMEALIQKHVAIDFLFNCAGFAQPGYIHEQEINVFRNMMNVNYFGILNATKVLVPYFLKNRQGHIINVSSIAGFLGLFGYTGYCASKYAVVGFSQALRQELRPFGVKVSVLCPPNTQTPGLVRENKFKPAEVLQVEEKVKVVTPEFVAEALLKVLPKGKFMIVPTFDGALAYHLSRLAPPIIDQFTKRRLAGGIG